jgi:hypothetical protein
VVVVQLDDLGDPIPSRVLACTVCGAPSFCKLIVEGIEGWGIGGSATYLVCTQDACIRTASARARDNLHHAAHRVRPDPGLDAGQTIVARSEQVMSDGASGREVEG